MPNLTEPEIAKWRAEAKFAIEFQEKKFGSWYKQPRTGVARFIRMDEENWSDYEVEDLRLKSKYTSPEVTYNQIHPFKKHFIASSYFQNPKPILTTKRREDEEYIPILEKSIQYYAKELKFKRQFQRSINYGALTDLGCILTGYFQDKGRIAKENQNIQEKTNLITKIKNKVFGREKGQPVEYDEFIRYETPFLTSIFPWDILFRANSRDITKLPYILYRSAHYISFIHELFPETKDLKGFNFLSREEQQIAGNALEEFNEIVTYEYFLMPGAMTGLEKPYLLTFLGDWDGITEDKPIDFHEFGFNIEGSPYTFLQFNDSQHSIYHTPEVAYSERLQHKLNNGYSRICELMEKFNIKVGYDVKKVEDESNLKNSRDSFYATKGPPQLAVGAPQHTSDIPPEIIKVIQMLTEAISFEWGIPQSAVSGVSQADFAISEKLGLGGMQVRLGKSGDIINDFTIDCYRKFIQVLRQSVEVETIKNIIGDLGINPETGQSFVIDWRKFANKWNWNSPVRAEWDIDLDVSSMQKPNPEVKRKQDIELIGTTLNPILLQKLQAEGYDIKVFELYKNILTDYEFRNVDKIIVNTRLQQRLAEERLQRMGLVPPVSSEGPGIIRPPLPTIPANVMPREPSPGAIGAPTLESIIGGIKEAVTK